MAHRLLGFACFPAVQHPGSSVRVKSAAIALLISCISFAALGADLVNPEGGTIEKRFDAPAGFKRVQCEKGSFEEYLRTFKLKEDGAPVSLYDGSIKKNKVWAAVLDMPILKKDLIQCADAIIKLLAEYLYQVKKFDKIAFTLGSGMKVPFSRFSEGWRVEVRGDKTGWVKKGKKGTGRGIFDEYLEFIYTYCGTASLSADMAKADIKDIKIGDVFIEGGSPGHVVIVVDLAENAAGEKIMILAQSYMPSQEMHVLKSFSAISPWYKVEDADLNTPEWKFKKGSLKRFLEYNGPGGQK
jgi:hypothetical protein